MQEIRKISFTIPSCPKSAVFLKMYAFVVCNEQNNDKNDHPIQMIWDLL